MQKIIISILLSFIFVISLTAQHSLFTPSEIGIKVNFFNSTIYHEHNYGSGLNNYLLTPGQSFGVSLGWALPNSAKLIFSPVFSQQGQNYEDWKVAGDPAYYFQRSIELKYWRFPFVYQKKYGKPKADLQWYYEGGIYFAALQSANLTYTRGGDFVDFVTAMTAKNDQAALIYQPNDFKDLFQPFDIGIVLGWGLDYALTPTTNFLAGLRWESSILDINSPDWRFPHHLYGYKASRNILLGIQLGLVFDLK